MLCVEHATGAVKQVSYLPNVSVVIYRISSGHQSGILDLGISCLTCLTRLREYMMDSLETVMWISTE